MVAVMVRQHDFGDVGGRQSRPGERAGQLLLDRDIEAREGDVARRRRLAAVDEQERPVVLDRPAKDRQWRRPGAGQEQVQLTATAGARVKEAVLDAYGPGLQRVDLHFESLVLD